MSKISSVVSLSPDLVQLFNSIKEENAEVVDISLLKVSIDIENLHLVLDQKVSLPLPITPDTLKSTVTKTEPCFLFVKQSSKLWNFISWVPDTSLKVKQRMVYASGRNVLKDGFGAKYLSNQYHFTTMLEFITSGKNTTQESRAPVKQLDRTTGLLKGKGLDEAERRSLMSRAELEREEAEDLARDQMLEGMLGKAKLSSIQSGGFHQVNLPLSQQAKDTAVSEKKDKLESSNPISDVEFWNKMTNLDLNLTTADPQIYILRLGNQPQPKNQPKPSSDDEERTEVEEMDQNEHGSYTNVLVYTCPPQSKPKLRMVYSTALSSLIDQLKGLNLNIHFKIEMFEDLNKTRYTYNTIYTKVNNDKEQVGVTKLQVNTNGSNQTNLNRIVQNSHQVANNHKEVQLPRFSKLPSHSVFGQPLPSLASEGNPIIKPKVKDFANWPQPQN